MAQNPQTRFSADSIASAIALPDADEPGRDGFSGPASSIKLRIIAGFAAITLAVALVIGIVAMRMGSEAGLAENVAAQMQNQLLWWGFGAVLVAALLGAIFARYIGEPIK